jgi:uncharacterized protein YjiS (DUF1127 family)
MNSLLARPPGPTLAAARVAIRRWRMRRWLKRNRNRISLIACGNHELSDLGRRMRREALRDLTAKLRDPALSDLDPRRPDRRAGS